MGLFLGVYFDISEFQLWLYLVGSRNFVPGLSLSCHGRRSSLKYQFSAPPLYSICLQSAIKYSITKRWFHWRSFPPEHFCYHGIKIWFLADQIYFIKNLAVLAPGSCPAGWCQMGTGMIWDCPPSRWVWPNLRSRYGESCWIRSPAPASPLAVWMKQPPKDVGSSDAQIKLRGVRGSPGTNNLLFVVRSGRLRTTSTMTVVQNCWLLLFSLVLQAFSSKNTYFSYFSASSCPFNFK